MATINQILAQKPIVQNITDNLDIDDLLSWALVSKSVRVIASQKIMNSKIKKTWKKAENGCQPCYYHVEKKTDYVPSLGSLDAYLYRCEGESSRKVAYGCVIGRCGCGIRFKCNMNKGSLDGPATNIDHDYGMSRHIHYRMDKKIKEYTTMEYYNGAGTFIVTLYEYGDEPYILNKMKKCSTSEENIRIPELFKKHRNWGSLNCPICQHFDKLIENSEL
jgi:hypothetical protein